MGLKGVTVYRDGSRSGVIVSSDDNGGKKFDYMSSPKRPKILKAKSHTTSVGGEKHSVFVGFMDKKPYEVFAYRGGTKECEGFIEKLGSGDYHFVGDEENARHRIITGKMTDEQETITRLISGSLRHGRNIKFIVDDLNKTSGSLFSFNSAIARVLKTYIPDGEKSSLKCSECGSKNVLFEEGCQRCMDCGSSKCG